MWNAGRLVAVSCLMLGAACGGSQKPNPLPAEEPMDKSGASTDSTPTTTAASTDSSDPSAADPSAGLSAGDPSTTAAATPPPDTTPAADPKGKGKGKKGKGTAAAGKGGELSSGECQQLSEKGIDLLVAGMGMTDPAMVAQLKSQAAGDPNFAGMQTECVKSTTRAQYKCGMAAKSKDAWEACLK